MRDDGSRPARRVARAAAGVAIILATAVLAGTFWYRAEYHAWPGAGASDRLHWCGRDYEAISGPRTWRQITAQASEPIQAVGSYPPLGLHRQGMLANLYPPSLRRTASSCATLVFLRSGRGRYLTYSLLGGP
jgi:hypothetical protein